MKNIGYSLLLLIVCFSLCYASFEFSTGKNISSSKINNNGWTYRDVELLTYNVSNIIIGGNFKSSNANRGNGKGNGNSNAAFHAGAAYVSILGYPFSFFSVFKSDTFNFSGSQNFVGVNMKGADGYAGYAFLSLEERDSNFKLVNTQTLKWSAIAQGINYQLSEQSAANSDLQYITFSGNSYSKNDNLTIEISYLIPKKAGMLSDSTVVTPNALESFIKINNYPYANVTNSLYLVIGVGSEKYNVHKSGSALLRTGDGAMFASFNNEAKVHGNSHSVNISDFTDADLSDVGNIDFSSQLSGKYGGNSDYKIVRIGFPAGAANIEWDPTVGTGTSVEEGGISGSSGSSLFPLSLLFLFSIAFLFSL